MNVREVDQPRNQIRIQLERLAIRGCRFLQLRLVPVVERGPDLEVLLGECRVRYRRGRTLSRLAAQLKDFCRRCVDAEVEGELALLLGQQRPGDSMERQPL